VAGRPARRGPPRPEHPRAHPLREPVSLPRLTAGQDCLVGRYAKALDALVAADQAIYGGADAPAICAEMAGARAIAGAARCL